MRKTLIATFILIAVLALSGKAAYAHHNANYPESVNPAFTGINLYSYHNDAIENSQQSGELTNTTITNQSGTIEQNFNFNYDETNVSGNLNNQYSRIGGQ